MVLLTEHHAETITAFYYVKGGLWLLGTLMLITYMNCKAIDQWAQRLRFITLLYFAMFGTWRSIDQIRSGDTGLSWHSVGAGGGALLLVITMVVSLVEDRGHTNAADTIHSKERPHA